MRNDLHKEWLENEIAIRMRCKSFLHPVGKRELDELQQDLEKTMQKIGELKVHAGE